MGIGGAGMSALALLARRRGVAVSGCDSDLAGAHDLVAAGVPVVAGHDAAHVAGCRAVVVTAAVKPDHPELVAARAAGIPVVPRKEALAQLIGDRICLAMAGTHGKTTTTVMTTLAMRAAGHFTTGLAGGRVPEWGGNALVGDDTSFVVEADEYDQAFLTLTPTVAVVTNVEPDHLECYGDFATLEAAFVTFAGRAQIAIVSADDAGARRLAGTLRTLGREVRTVGTSADASIRITEVRQDAGRTTAVVQLPGAGACALALRVPGMHNLRNAATALAVVDTQGGDLAAAADALGAFEGVGRRFERIGELKGIEIVDDYAHHPTEVVATLEAARQRYPERRIVAVFQPHLYSRTQAHGAALGQSLAGADLALVSDVYGAREQPIAGITGAVVVEAAKAAGVDVAYVPMRAELLDAVKRVARAGDVVLTLGAGDVTRVGRELAAWLASAP